MLILVLLINRDRCYNNIITTYQKLAQIEKEHIKIITRGRLRVKAGVRWRPSLRSSSFFAGCRNDEKATETRGTYESLRDTNWMVMDFRIQRHQQEWWVRATQIIKISSSSLQNVRSFSSRNRSASIIKSLKRAIIEFISAKSVRARASLQIPESHLGERTYLRCCVRLCATNLVKMSFLN